MAGSTRRVAAALATTILMLAGAAAAQSIPVQPAGQPGSGGYYDLRQRWLLNGQIVSGHLNPPNPYLSAYVLNATRTDYVRTAAGTPVVFHVALAGGSDLTATTLVVGAVFSLTVAPAVPSLEVNPVVSGRGGGYHNSGAIVFCPATTPPALPPPGRTCADVAGSVMVGISLPAAQEWAALTVTR